MTWTHIGNGLYLCESTDTKITTGITTGSMLFESTVGTAAEKAYRFNGTTWVELSLGTGGGGSGDITGAANVGTGEGFVFRDEVTGVLNLKKIKAGTNVTVTNGTDDITVASTGSGGITASSTDTLTNKTIVAANNTISGIVDANIGTHTTTKISTTSKSLLNTAIVYNDQTNSFGDFNQVLKDNRLLINNPADTFSYTVIAAAIAANRNITLPLLTANDTAVTEAFTQTLTNKTLAAASNTITGLVDANIDAHTTTKITTTAKGQLNSSIVYTDQTNALGDFNQVFKDNRLLINNPADTFSYTLIGAAIAAARNITLPLLTANDTFVTEAFAQTLTNKTMSGSSNTFSNINWSTLTSVPTTFAPSAHASSHNSAGGTDVVHIDTIGAGTDVTTNNVSTSKHGLAPKLSNVVTEFLNGQGGWTTPAGSGGESNTYSTVGTGSAWTLTKSGVNLPFRSFIVGSTKLQLTANTNDLTLDVNQANLSIAWGQLTSVPGTFAPSAHTHAYGDLTSIPTTLVKTDQTNTYGAFAQIFPNSQLKVNNPAGTFAYTVVSSAIAAARNVTLPLLTADDTLVTAAFAQTLTNKTIAAGSNTVTGIVDTNIDAHTSTKVTITAKGQLNSALVYTDQANALGDFNLTLKDNRLLINNPADTFSYTVVAAAIAANRTVTLPLLTGNDTMVTEAFTQTLTNKSLSGASNTFTLIPYSALTSVPTTFAPSAHASTHNTGGSDVVHIDTVGSGTDITTNNTSTSKHGLFPKLPGGTTNFWREDGTWQPASGGTAENTLARAYTYYIYKTGSTYYAQSGNNITSPTLTSNSSFATLINGLISGISPAGTPTKFVLGNGDFDVAAQISIPYTAIGNITIEGQGMGLTNLIITSAWNNISVGTPAIRVGLTPTISAGITGTLTANCAVRSVSCTVSTADAAKFAVGDYVVLTSTLAWSAAPSAASTQAEMKRITAINTGTGVITFDVPTFDTYNTANTAVIYKQYTMMSNMVFSDLTIKKGSGLNTDLTNATGVVFFEALTIDNLTMERVQIVDPVTNYDSTMALRSVINSRVTGCSFIMNPANTYNLQYGVSIGRCSQNIIVDGCRSIGKFRHPFEGTNDETGIAGKGIIRNVTFSNCTAEGSEIGGFDTHVGGEMISFVNCKVLGTTTTTGNVGFEIRTRKTQLVGCSVIGATTRGFQLSGDAHDCELSNCTATGNITEGLRLVNDYQGVKRTRVVGGNYSNNGNNGIRLDADCDYTQIIGAVVNNNLNNGMYILDTDHHIITGCIVNGNANNGIWFDDTVAQTDNILMNNNLEGNGTALLIDTGTTVYHSNNIGVTSGIDALAAVQTNKTVNTTDNSLTATSQATGDILKSNGTKFVRMGRGTSLQVLRTNSGGTDLEWAASSGGGITASSTDTLTNKTIDADGTGNVISNIENADIKAAAGIITTKLADSTAFVLTSRTNTFGAFDQIFPTSRLLVGDSDASHNYLIAGSNLAANRTITLPLLTGNDTAVTEAFAQTLTNKTMSGASNTFSNIAWGSLTSVPTTFAPSTHASSHNSAGGDVVHIDTIGAGTDITTNDSSTSKHGLLRKLSNTATEYMDGTGVWSVPAGGGGGGITASSTNTLTNKTIDALFNPAPNTVVSPQVKKIGWAFPDSTTVSVFGTFTRLVLAGTLTATNDSTHGRVASYDTGGTANSRAGFLDTSTATPLGNFMIASNFIIKIKFKIASAAMTAQRIGIGFVSTNTIPTTDTMMANADSGIMFGQRTSDTNFQIFHNDGSGAHSVTAYGDAIAPSNTWRILTITANSATPSVSFQIDSGTVTTITTDLPAVGTGLLFRAYTQNSTTTAKKFDYAWIWAESNI